jgi:hypothetical protein
MTIFSLANSSHCGSLDTGHGIDRLDSMAALMAPDSPGANCVMDFAGNMLSKMRPLDEDIAREVRSSFMGLLMT